MTGMWDDILAAMLRAREVRRLGGAPEPLLRDIGRMRAAKSDLPASGALLDLVAAAARGPLVIGQLGQTLDGRIATAGGHSHYVNGPVALDHLHRLRALADAVLVGAGTLRGDDPALTVRRCRGENPVRIVLTGGGPVPRDRKVFADGAATTLVTGVDLPCEAGEGGIVSARSVLDSLAAIGLDVVLIEGGAVTLSRFLAAGCLDRLHLLVAPTVLGSGRPGIMLDEVQSMDQVIRFTASRHDLGEDTLFDLVPRRD